jgi:hypothetical protein
MENVLHQQKISKNPVGTAMVLIQWSMLCKPRFGLGIPKVMPLGHVILGILPAKTLEDVLLRTFGILINRLGTIPSSNAVAMVGPVVWLLVSVLTGLNQTKHLREFGAVGVPSNSLARR